MKFFAFRGVKSHEWTFYDPTKHERGKRYEYCTFQKANTHQMGSFLESERHSGGNEQIFPGFLR